MLPRTVNDWHEQGEAQHARGDLAGAEASFRQLLILAPDDAFARLSLGAVLNDAGRPADAQSLLAEGLARATDPRLKAAHAYHLGFAHYHQGHKQAALDAFTQVRSLDPGQSNAELHRAGLLEELARGDEALAALKALLAREPQNEKAHTAYNDLIWRLGREEEFLQSYDRAPPSPALLLGKASFLLKTGKAEAAHILCADLARREPDNLAAVLTAATALNQLGRHGEATTALDQALQRWPSDTALLRDAAASALQNRDPQKAAAMAQRGLTLAPHDQMSLAVLGSAWRLQGDARDETLNRYDALIQVFDLEPPEGFSDMAAFNAELATELSTLHTDSREPLTQTLRRGSQTRGNIFGAGHDLVERLKQRIAQSVERYIDGLDADTRHPFLGRRAAGFRFTGSWSSRLRDCGFHVNHIHPEGWISSCYYVGLPDAVQDQSARQGWITFGAPSFDVGLGVRRAIQPAPGRLVLFPSFMWHGTVPFQSDQPRTTIAFDALPR